MALANAGGSTHTRCEEGVVWCGEVAPAALFWSLELASGDDRSEERDALWFCSSFSDREGDGVEEEDADAGLVVELSWWFCRCWSDDDVVVDDDWCSEDKVFFAQKWVAVRIAPYDTNDKYKYDINDLSMTWC